MMGVKMRSWAGRVKVAMTSKDKAQSLFRVCKR